MLDFIERRVFGMDAFAEGSTRHRARALGYLLLGLIPLSGLTIITVDFELRRMALLAICILFSLSLLILRLGSLRISVALTLSSLAFIAAALPFTQPFEHRLELYQMGSLGLFVIILSSLLAESVAPTWLCAGIGLSALVAEVALRQVPSAAGIKANEIDDIVVMAFGYIAGAAILTVVANRNRRLLSTAEGLSKRERIRAQDFATLVGEARLSLDSGAGLTESAERTERLVREILDRNAAVRERLDALQSEARRVEAASSAMAGAASGSANAVDDQVAVVEQTSAAVVEMTASIEAISRIAQERREAIQALAAGAATGAQAIARVTEAMAGLRGRVASTGEIVKVIKKVASQTGLLAMNASIEAAHAGEAGGGFAVVATEIRNLADETARNAKIIAETLGAVAASITQAGATNEEASLAYEGVRTEIEKVASAIGEIAQGVAELSAGTDEINRGTQQSVSSTQAVREAVSTVSSRVTEVEAGLRSQESAAAAIVASLAEMAERLSGLGAEAARVREAGLANQTALTGLGKKLEELGAES